MAPPVRQRRAPCACAAMAPIGCVALSFYSQGLQVLPHQGVYAGSRTFIGTVVAVAIFCAQGWPADAALVTFESEAGFLAAAGGGLATADFEALSAASFQTLSNTTSSTNPLGVTFSSNLGTAVDLFVAPANFNGNTAIATASLFANGVGTPLIADFSPNVTAVGSDLISFTGSGSTSAISIAVLLQDGTASTYAVTPLAGSSSFFGIIATGGDSVPRISYGPLAGFTVGVDDFRFGTAQATAPEPASMLLRGGGLLGAGVRRLRQKRP